MGGFHTECERGSPRRRRGRGGSGGDLDGPDVTRAGGTPALISHIDVDAVRADAQLHGVLDRAVVGAGTRRQVGGAGRRGAGAVVRVEAEEGGGCGSGRVVAAQEGDAGRAHYSGMSPREENKSSKRKTARIII